MKPNLSVWLCDLTYDQQVIAADTMPTNIAYLASYAKYNSDAENSFKLFKYPDKLISAISNLDLPDVIGFSHFSWNNTLSLRLAEKIKKINPKIIVVFGGLQYPDDKELQIEFLKKNRVIDFYVYKEGEIAFSNLINLFVEYDLDVEEIKSEKDVIGAHYIRPNGDVFISPPAQRLKDQSSYPSPYLSGMLDEFFDENLMPVLTTNRGCPFTCTFCAEGTSYYNVVNKFNKTRVIDEIEYIAKKVSGDKLGKMRKEVYISDSNFGMYKEDVSVAEKFKEVYEKYNWPKGIIATTGKNHKIRILEVAKILPGSVVYGLSASVQSMDVEVLKNIRRSNIKSDTILDVAKEATKNGTATYAEIILALPGDSLVKHLDSAKQLINAKYDEIMSRQLILFRGSEMDSIESRKNFGFKTKFRVLTKSYGVYNFKENDNIAVSEIEEVVVGGKNLTYYDYLEARRFNLVVNIFYNHKYFSGFLKILDGANIDRYSWIIKIFEKSKKNKNFKKLLDQFTSAGEEELWNDRDELLKFLSVEKNIKNIIDGEYGANLLAKYRIVAIYDYMKEMCKIAKESTLELLIDKNLYSKNLEKFLLDLEKYEYHKKGMIFDPSLKSNTEIFNYDIKSFEENKKLKDKSIDFESFKLKTIKEINFFRDEATASLIKNNVETYGLSHSGLYKQMTRVNIQKLYRKTEYI